MGIENELLKGVDKCVYCSFVIEGTQNLSALVLTVIENRDERII